LHGRAQSTEYQNHLCNIGNCKVNAFVGKAGLWHIRAVFLSRQENPGDAPDHDIQRRQATMTSMLVWAAAIVGVAGLVIAINYILPWLARKWAERALQATCRAQGAVVLTYDDGPGEQLTAALLDLLDREGVRASFYMLGERIAARPEIVRSAIARGHDVGAHGERHVNAWYANPLAAARDFDAGRRSVAAVGGNPTMFRPPYGKLTLIQSIIERRRGSRLGWWSVDSRDSWDRRPVGEVVDEVIAARGGVVLMHDYDRYDAGNHPVAHQDHVLDLTCNIIAAARDAGLRVVPMSALPGHN
jgi:peptidoglycan-N-acetylglucosamine deacetylase